MSLSGQLKDEMKFAEELRAVLDMMRQVAAAELARVEGSRVTTEALREELAGGFGLLEEAKEQNLRGSDPFKGEQRKGSDPFQGVVLLTSDTGFVGELNIRVVREGLETLKGSDPLKTNPEGVRPLRETQLFVLGEQGRRMLLEEGVAHTALAGIEQVREAVLKAVASRSLLVASKDLTSDEQPATSHGLSRVALVYPRYLSFSRQEVVREEILPVASRLSLVASEQREPQPTSNEQLATSNWSSREIILESRAGEIERELTAWWLAAWLIEAAWHARSSELAARVTHLEQSLEELSKQSQALTLQHFRALHEEMDQQIREVYASRLQELQ